MTATAHHLDYLDFAHDMAVKAAAFPDDKATVQAPGQPNHCLWTLGHLAETYNWAASLFDGNPRSLPAEYATHFGMGSTPTADPKAYPPVAEVRANFDRAFERMRSAAAGMSQAQLNESLKEATRGFADTKLDLIYKMAWHDGWHLGQLSTLRKFLGLPGLFA